MDTKRIQVVCNLTTKNITDSEARRVELMRIPHVVYVVDDEITFEYCGFEHGMKNLVEDKVKAKAVVEKFTQDRLVNLCDTCVSDFVDCDAINKEYGDGPGNDNVIVCDAYTIRD